jgi:hypothetical protein
MRDMRRAHTPPAQCILMSANVSSNLQCQGVPCDGIRSDPQADRISSLDHDN